MSLRPRSPAVERPWRGWAIAAALLCSSSALAQSFPARSGETGILDVPDAEVAGIGNGQVAAEVRVDRVAGSTTDVGALPIYGVAGVSRVVDLGLTMREWGQPGDPRPARMLFGAAAKLQLVAPSGLVPGVALSAVADRVNARGVLGARVAVSTAGGPVRIAAFGGAEVNADGMDGLGATAGLALSVPIVRAVDVAAEGLTGPRGANLGLALRWAATATTGISLGANYFPGDDGFRISLAFAFAPRVSRPARAAKAAAPPQAKPEEEVATAARLTDDRPKFRLRTTMRDPAAAGEPRRLQYGPQVASASAPAKPAAGQPAAAPASAPAEAGLREQEGLADARERKARGSSDQLGERERQLAADTKGLDDRARELAVREQQLDAREKRIAAGGAPTQRQQQLESSERELAAQERQLVAQDRSLGPAVDAAQGREREAASREESEQREAKRISAAAGKSSGPAQLELRKQALAAKTRRIAALEARIAARGERLEALGTQLRTRSDRLDAWTRRLGARAERLDLLEKRAADAGAPPKAPEPAPSTANLVMVVKSPTVLTRVRSLAPAATGAGAALHPGVAVEKTVAAATVLSFPNTMSQLSELDLETIDNIAKVAAKDRCEVLVWARAKDPGLMAEAQRRAAEIRSRVLAAAPLDAAQVVTRLTTSPGAKGVDVVVSALRDASQPAAAGPAAPIPATLLAGESGKRQVREAVMTVQPGIEACVAAHLKEKRIRRASGTLRLTLTAQGKVRAVSTSRGDLSSDRLESCLGAASAAWQFPSAEADYGVNVPITVMTRSRGAR